MYIEQIYTGCLAQGAYYIESNGEAAIIDPLREVLPYIQKAEQRGAKIKYIFETHFHADFVSGHLDLASKTNAPIVFGPKAEPAFEAHIASDQEVFTIGNISITLLHTPGHTLESSCYLLKDETGEAQALFSGDTLFLGDVGRPDLAQKAADMTQEDLAGMLYDSLMHKIMPLPNHVMVYPAHGAGSACGKNMMKETQDTLGNQKQMNYALNQPDKAAFIAAVTDGLTPPPGYFGMNVAMNKKGYNSFDEVMARGMQALSPDALETVVESANALVLDVRSAADFAKGHIPGAINIGLKGDFAPWVGAMIVDVHQNLVLVVDQGMETEAITRLSRVGFDHVLGYLNGGMSSWTAANKAIDSVDRISPEQFASEYTNQHLPVIDVRKEAEFASEHVVNAQNKSLAYLNDWMHELPKTTFLLHCQGGYRSMIAASILKARGIHDFKEVDGGFKAITATSVPLENGLTPCQIKAQ